MTHGVSGYVQGCRCTDCRKGHLRYHRTWRKARYEAGTCRLCNRKRLARFTLCSKCQDRSRAYQQARKAAVTAPRPEPIPLPPVYREVNGCVYEVVFDGARS